MQSWDLKRLKVGFVEQFFLRLIFAEINDFSFSPLWEKNASVKKKFSALLTRVILGRTSLSEQISWFFFMTLENPAVTKYCKMHAS